MKATVVKATINSAIDAQKWGSCQTDPIPLDPEKPTWFGLDLSFDLCIF